MSGKGEMHANERHNEGLHESTEISVKIIRLFYLRNIY